MSEIFHHGFNALGHGLIGYAVPFLFVLTIVVFFHELGHFLVALQRPPRHPLEDLGGAARRLRQILRR
jgi:hypothetical protein